MHRRQRSAPPERQGYRQRHGATERGTEGGTEEKDEERQSARERKGAHLRTKDTNNRCVFKLWVMFYSVTTRLTLCATTPPANPRSSMIVL